MELAATTVALTSQSQEATTWIRVWVSGSSSCCWLLSIIHVLWTLTYESLGSLSRLTAGGFRVIYDRETPFELRIQVYDSITNRFS